MKLKIGRYEYEITNKDVFMDNGACVQLLTQSQERSNWGHQPHPVLSKKAEIEINKYKHKPVKHNYSSHVKEVFRLKL